MRGWRSNSVVTSNKSSVGTGSSQSRAAVVYEANAVFPARRTALNTECSNVRAGGRIPEHVVAEILDASLFAAVPQRLSDDTDRLQLLPSAQTQLRRFDDCELLIPTHRCLPPGRREAAGNVAAW